MGNSPRSRTRQQSRPGKGLPRGARELDSRRTARSSLASLAKPLSPAASNPSDPEAGSTTLHRRARSSEDIAPEIVVWTEDMDTAMTDSSPLSAAPASPGPPTPEDKQIASTPSPTPTLTSTPRPASPQPPPPHAGPPDPVQDETRTKEPSNVSSSLSSLSEHSDLSSIPPPAAPPYPVQDETPAKEPSNESSSLSSLSEHSDLSSIPLSVSSKATTPVDVDSSRDAPATATSFVRQPASSPRRKWDVRPKVSIPPDLPLAEYAMQCVAAAEASRLNPYSLHQEEYLMLRDHISHGQVTTYLNIRNGILRLWVRNPQIPVMREEAVGCAKDPRWFDVASVCFDWLVRRGYINFGCLEVRTSRKHTDDGSFRGRRKTVVVIGAGMAGLGCARQLEGLFAQYAKRFRGMGEEPPRVVVLEGRNRVGGRVYSRSFQTRPQHAPPGFEGKRFTAEMGGMIITGFDRGNPLNILLRGQLGLAYHLLRPETTLYDSNGKPVDLHRDQLVENLYNDCLDRVSEYKFKQPASKLIEGNKDLIDEGKDSSSEAHKTIRQAEESAAAQPYAAPVSEQNIAPQVNLVPVSTDRATGRIHTEPGTPGALKAAHKVKLMGWTLKHGVSEDADLDLEPATQEPGATLGSVTDRAIAQYRDLLDLTAQDFRLMNWHIANLEYSNATNYHQLSLQGWDIDAGNEWEGSHSMVVGGYQSVPRGLMRLPTSLNVKQRSPVSKITYTKDSPSGPATVECEDGSIVEADYVVSTIPLGVLKHGNVKFEPPLPSWKTNAIDRLGFGVLNKVILVYKQPFWDEDRDIFGVLRNPTNRHSLDQKDYASQRGRFFQWFNVTRTSGLPVLIALMAGDAGFDTEQTCNDDLVAEATEILRSVYGQRVPQPVEAVVTRWASDKFARGSYSSAGPDMKADDYDIMARPVGNLFFAGEHTCGTHPATVHGAYLSGLRAASEVLDAMLGPIAIPSPLILPKDSLLKHKASSLFESGSSSASSGGGGGGGGGNNHIATRDTARSRLEAYEAALWDHLIAQLGPPPPPPAKPATNAYIFYSRAHHEDARRRLESGRRPGKGKPSANEVRMMSARMWRDAGEAERRPYVEMAEEQKRQYTEALARFRDDAAAWDRAADAARAEYERANPRPGGGAGTAATATAPPPTTENTAGAGLEQGKPEKAQQMLEKGTNSSGGGGSTNSGSESSSSGRKRKLQVGNYAEVDSEMDEGGDAEDHQKHQKHQKQQQQEQEEEDDKQAAMEGGKEEGEAMEGVEETGPGAELGTASGTVTGHVDGGKVGVEVIRRRKEGEMGERKGGDDETEKEMEMQLEG